MKRVAMLILLSVLVICPAFPDQVLDYTPYDPLEFPAWARELRRAEIIFFGSLPLSFGAAGLILPRFIEGEIPTSTRLISVVSLSAAVSLADFIIGRVSK